MSLRPAPSVEHKSRIGALADSKDGDGPEALAVATGCTRNHNRTFRHRHPLIVTSPWQYPRLLSQCSRQSRLCRRAQGRNDA